MPRRFRAGSFELQPLESRLFLSSTASLAAPSPSAHLAAAAATITPSAVLSKALRQKLVDHWSGSNKASLKSALDDGKLGAFDTRLLSYLRSTAHSLFFKPSDIDSIVSFINANLATAPTIAHADAILAHKFPTTGSGGDSYTVQLPAGEIGWTTQPANTKNTGFIPGLNQQAFWLDLAQACRFTGNSKYVTEIATQLASWSKQNPALSNPNDFEKAAPHWDLFATSLRAGIWTWVYPMILDSSAWTAADNTIFLAKLFEHGDFLRRVTPYALGSNRAISHAQGLLQVAQLIPEFTGASEWKTYARKLLFDAMDHQLYPDGGHVEESPGYAANIINDLLECYWLDQVKGESSAWPADRVARLHNAMEAHVQLLSPNGNLAALSDTYRSTSVQMFTKARIILKSSAWPYAKPRIRDVWLFGASTSAPLLSSPVTPALSDRGRTFDLPDSGYYIMRSGADADARQITFDAGPTGGVHGHFDLLNFELFGYGKPLISDPGLYQYDQSANRNYVISTKAHNTINVDGVNHAAVEGAHSPGIVIDQWTDAPDHAQIAAHHYGYNDLKGNPVVARNIWYDYDGVALIVDWGQASSSHQYQISFNIPGDSTTVTGVQSDGSFRSKYSSGNVEVAPLLRAGQTAARGALTFVSNHAPPNETDPAYRFTVSGSGTFQAFATLVTTYAGTTPPNITAEWVTKSPQPGQPIVLRLTKNGVSQDITFAAPLQTPPKNLASSTGAANDLAFDSSDRLHMAYFDRLTRNLKYTVRDTVGRWSAVQTIDPDLDTGVYVSLAIDSTGAPAVAYFDGNGGNLKYARFHDKIWDVQTIDTAGSVGLYPSLVFSRTNVPIITYYNRTKGELRMATTAAKGWYVTTIDTAGDVGRFSSAQLDPNNPTESRLAVAYEDSTNGSFKYAIQGTTGWNIQTIDNHTTSGGGYTSLQFQPTRSPDGTYHPAVSYYDSGNSALKFAIFNGAAWQSQTVIAAGKVGLYTNLVSDNANRPNIFFFSKSANKAYRAILDAGAWTFSPLGPGGREMHTARSRHGVLAYSTLDESGPLLQVGILAS